MWWQGADSGHNVDKDVSRYRKAMVFGSGGAMSCEPSVGCLKQADVHRDDED
jgi:hypothetical protein